MKEFKSLRCGIKRKIDSIHKMRKKITKENSTEVTLQIEKVTNDLYTDYRVLEKQERQAVRRINLEERSQLCDFAAAVRQVLIGEVSFVQVLEDISDVVNDISKVINSPQLVPDNLESVIHEALKSGEYNFDTPISSTEGSLKGSRCGSLRSISSLVNSRSNSPLCIEENTNFMRSRSGSARSFEPVRNRYKIIISKILNRECLIGCQEYQCQGFKLFKCQVSWNLLSPL